ncbi:hypothetical protein [Clostridium estertheticum]|uniref:hypothetical protein n=1 Tax=Clostridium estertheticum TaxID=238834 RepID=UPI001CF5BE92|nr:hypothetical protein [Clostridium estertheticum]MCB2357022.1 hypothetical protein [Clostridium estertheticum]WAG43909.1 hypothetical protein LL065_25780 [Clostridium estertheticum]
MKITGDNYKNNIAMLICLADDAELSIEDITDLTEDITELILILHEKRKRLKKQK